MGITLEGIEGEQFLMKFLHKKGFTVFQPGIYPLTSFKKDI